MAASGLGYYASFEPLGWWPAGILSIIFLILGLSPWNSPTRLSSTVSARWGMVLGFTQSLVAFLFLLPWVGEFVGKTPYLALVFALSLYGILLGGVGALILKQRWGLTGFVLFFVSVEYFRSSWPFGGFSWVRLAWGQIDGPFASLARWGGPALVTAATVGCAASLLALVWHSKRTMSVLSLSVIALATILAHSQVNNPDNTVGFRTVAAIQGNVPRMGLDFNAQRRAVLTNHVRESEKVTEPVDFMIWPENSVDVNPLRDPQSAQLVEEALQHSGVPILIGTITEDEVGDRNTMLVMDPKAGPQDFHYKKYLQPFGEYMPMRNLLRHVSKYVDLAGNFQPGTGDGVVTIAGIKLGIATCYEVAFDNAGRDAVLHGAQLLSTPTNNATFGFTNMTYQQLAMSRMRALELDRAVVVSATSGVSAMVQPDGTVSQSTRIFEANHLVAELPLRDNLTFAARYGVIVQLLMVIMGVLSGAIALFKHQFHPVSAQQKRARKKRKK
ncbi:apolipoprotein N-acyltransferase [Corynebacterium poyangense]|uniref:Apolipoprotein N-acyltransferase n=1 Tax=Corynebacterium poyangense TaxID=2684405 RepID=A0A7H0SSA2_9CORY|nr:apolipoprotein N-acyltransferase [Corynebacterium poyangense]QNQ91427.1 apolipoprotein N-acyltransferase [Corynebacterium poyangense]